MTDHRRVDSFEREHVDAVAAGTDTIAVVTNGRVDLITETGRTTFEHDGVITDIALSNRVALLTDRKLVAYSRDGDQLWEQSRPDAYAVAARADGTVGVLTPETIHTLDDGAGQERTSVDRRRSGRSSDDDLVAVDDGFVVASWSFLTGVSDEGEISFDRNFDTVIRSVGRCGNVLVVSFQNDRLAGVDGSTGERQWRTELPVSHVSPTGDGDIFVTTADGIRTIAADGSIDAASDIDDGRVYAATDGSVICSIRSGTVSIHAPIRSSLGVEIATDSVGVGGSIEVVATNGTNSECRTGLKASLDGGTLSPSEREVDLEPGASEILDFPVASVTAEGTATVEIRDGNAVLGRSTVAIQDAADTTLGVETSLRPVEIVDGIATLELTVENVGSVALDGIHIFETNEQVSDIQPGTTWSTTVSQPFDPNEAATVGLEATRGARRSEFAPTCTLPAAPTIDLEVDGDALQARVEVDGGVRVTDQLVVEMPGFGRTRTRVEIEDGLLLVVPTFEDGTARVRLGDLDVAERQRVSGRSAHASSSRLRTDESPTSPRFDDSESSEHPTHEGQISSDRSASLRDAGSTNSDGTETPGRNVPSAGATDSDLGGASAARNGPEGDRGGVSSDVTVERSVDRTPTRLGQVVRDRVTLESVDNVPDLYVETDDDYLDVGTPEESTIVLERKAVVFDDTEEMSAIEVYADEAAIGHLPEEAIEVDERGVHARIAVDPEDGFIRGDLHNGSEETIRLHSLHLGKCELTPRLEQTLDAGERIDLEGKIRRTPDFDADVVDATLELERSSGTSETLKFAAAVQPIQRSSDAESLVAASIGESTEVAGDYGTAVVVIQNESDDTLSNVSVSAESDDINRMLYSDAHRQSLPPGDRVEHYIDLKATDSEVAIELDVTFEVSGAERTLQYRATGPAPENEREWTDDHREAWSVSSRSQGGTDSIDLPPLLVTQFHRI